MYIYIYVSMYTQMYRDARMYIHASVSLIIITHLTHALSACPNIILTYNLPTSRHMYTGICVYTDRS